MYSLKSPNTPDDWREYHEIRRRVLWESRGRFGVYDEAHPDEHKLNHFPLLLIWDSKAIGVVRIDLQEGRAVLRRVAIRHHVQRSGHGTNLMRLAEDFARDRGLKHLYSFVDPIAVGFYEKCGFQRDLKASSVESVPMEKWL